MTGRLSWPTHVVNYPHGKPEFFYTPAHLVGTGALLHSLQDGNRKEGEGSEGEAGEIKRRYEQCQDEGRELLSVGYIPLQLVLMMTQLIQL